MYVCEGFCEVDVVPSPKVQAEPLMDPSGSLLEFVKLHVSALQLDVNAAVGGWFGALTVTECDTLPVAPWLSVTVSVTVNVPPAVYV